MVIKYTRTFLNGLIGSTCVYNIRAVRSALILLLYTNEYELAHCCDIRLLGHSHVEMLIKLRIF